MSKADRTAFGRPFAPMIATAMGGNAPSYSALNSNWDTYIEPYRNQWAHPDDGIEFGIYLHVLYWSAFYVNQNNKPSNPTNHNDPAYDWSYLDGIENGVDALRTGKAKLHFRWDTESSGIPNFLENQGDTFNGTGGRPVAAWHRSNVQKDARDFWTAFAARYNGASWLAGISHEEDNSGPNPPSDWTGAAWTSGRANVVRHTYNVLPDHTVFLAQSSGVHSHLTDIPVGRFMDDTKPGAFGCGSANRPFPIYDCTDGVLAGIQNFNGTIENPPGGIPKPTWSSSMPNGWGSRNDGNYGESNPWGRAYPIPGETSVPTTPNADPDWNATQFLSYIAGEPRAPSPLDDSGLGQAGRDNAGIVPSMVVLVNGSVDTPQAWNRAFTLFGGQGTRACPAVPWDWMDDSGGGSGNEITVIMGFSTTQSWLQAMMTEHTNTNIIAVMVGGGDIDYWNTGSNMANGVEETWSSNQGNKEDGDVIVYQVAGPERSAAQWEADIETAITNIRNVFTSLSRITLIPVIGGPDNGLCPSDGANNINGNVRDSVTHPDIEQAIINVAAGYSDVDWVDCNIDSCSWFSDGIGHITTDGGIGLGEKMWNVLFSSQPPPTQVQANPDTLPGVGKNSGTTQILNSTLMSNDTGDSLVVSSVSNAQNCTAVLDAVNGRVAFIPTTGFSGDATFQYTLSGDGGTSTAQVTVPVGNLPPVMFEINPITINAGQASALNLVGQDPEGDVLNFSIESQPIAGEFILGDRLADNSVMLLYTAPIDASGLVTGGTVACTDSDPTEPLKSNVIEIIYDVIAAEQGVFSVTIDEDEAVITGGDSAHVYGVTIDDISSLSSITDAIDSLGVSATTRIVFDEGQSASSYRTAFDAIKAVSDVMGEILDSSAMSAISVANFKTRVDDYLDEFGTEVDIWEIGNEVNGDWLGSTASVVEKIEYAYDEVVAAGGTTALTLYYNKDCNSGSDEMFTWAQANVAARLKAGLDYVLISYWEEDCNDVRPDWGPIFQQLGAMFPSSYIGFSEVGSEGSEATREEFIEYYYALAISHSRYIGGHFWWYFKDDCVPKTEALWSVLDTAITNTPITPRWASPAIGIPSFDNVEGVDWVVHRVEIQQDNITVTKPSGLSVGDTLLVIAACDGSADIAMTISPDAGWTNRYNVRTSGTSLAVWDKVITDSEPGNYVVRKGGVSEEWVAYSLALDAGSTFDSLANTSGIGSQAVAPSLTPGVDNTILFFVAASDDPDETEDANAFTDANMVGNKWSSNTSGMVMLAAGFDTQNVVQETTARDLFLDVSGRWEGLTLAYTQQLSGFSGAYGGDAYLNEGGVGSGSVCYSTTPSGVDKNWVRIYSQWPVNDVVTGPARYTTTIGGAAYPDTFVDQSINGGQMNAILALNGPLPGGDIAVCIYDNADTPVFADAVRIDYAVGEQGFITFTKQYQAGGILKAPRQITTQAHAYILESGGSLFSFTKTMRADALLYRPQDKWDTAYKSEAVWLLVNSRQ